MSGVYNFSAGPSALPEPVLLQAKEELPDWHHTGLSVGGLRASIFNAMPEQGVSSLIAFMQDFEQRRG